MEVEMEMEKKALKFCDFCISNRFILFLSLASLYRIQSKVFLIFIDSSERKNFPSTEPTRLNSNGYLNQKCFERRKRVNNRKY